MDGTIDDNVVGSHDGIGVNCGLGKSAASAPCVGEEEGDCEISHFSFFFFFIQYWSMDIAIAHWALATS